MVRILKERVVCPFDVDDEDPQRRAYVERGLELRRRRLKESWPSARGARWVNGGTSANEIKGWIRLLEEVSQSLERGYVAEPAVNEAEEDDDADFDF